MKDAKGHGSNKRGGAAHQSRIDAMAGPERRVPIDSIRPRPENTAMLDKLDKTEDAREAAFKDAYPGEAYTRDGPREQVEKYRQDFLGGANFPPLAVNRNNSIEDGEKRWRAFKAAGATHVKVRVLR